MKVLVDTCIWSLALRRSKNPDADIVNEFANLIREVKVQMIGPVRQELLSGVKSNKQFKELKNYLQAFSDLPLETQDHELAAECFNINKEKGIQGSNTDFLICSLSIRYQMPIFTTDGDFLQFKRHVPIFLYKSFG
jgi:predicted nucleic acid-binding protein